MPTENASTPEKITSIADRLIKLLGMLGSEHPGERAAAALKADTLLKREGLRWSDVVARAPAAIEYDHDDDSDDWRTMARTCVARADLLSDRELSFVQTMARWRGEPSDKQLHWLESIHERVGDCR